MVKGAGRRVLMGGNIGIPVLDLLEEPETDYYVLELSSFQLETTFTLDATASVVLNVSPDHMDRYADIAAYANAKQRIYGLKGFDHGTMVVNRDDEIIMSMVRPNRHVVSFGLGEATGNHFGRVKKQGELWLSRDNQPLLPVSALRMTGVHNQANALAALALGDVIGLPMVVMLNVLRTFTGLPHRTQWVADINGVTWINDSKGTNVGATLTAINGFDSPVVLIAGGQGKNADFSVLKDAVEKKSRAVILFGEDASVIEKALADSSQILHASDVNDAVQKAYEVAQENDVVLFSPACASFDMFKNFEARGKTFIEAVHRLQDGGAL
jgi:UDP-N-acetylmuramoylalanine--D-glutamate ligase